MSMAAITMIILSIIRLSTPVFSAGLGNMFCERVGILNLGSEGMMISGAFCATIGSHFSGNAWVGVLCGMLGGALTAMIHGVVSIEFGGMQAISGLGLNMFAIGLTTFLCSAIFKSTISPSVPALTTSEWAKNIPVVGKFMSQLSPIIYLSVILAIISYIIIYKTPLGMRICAVGDDPKAVETAGIDVWKTKYLGVFICGLLCGLAGSYMALGQLDRFVKGMTQGKGMLAVIAVKMGKWNPVGILGTALLLGVFDAIQLELQFSNAFGVPPELIQILPFVAGIIILSLQNSSDERPSSLEKPYLRNKYRI